MILQPVQEGMGWSFLFFLYVQYDTETSHSRWTMQVQMQLKCGHKYTNYTNKVYEVKKCQHPFLYRKWYLLHLEAEMGLNNGNVLAEMG